MSAKRTDSVPVCSIFGTGDKYLSVNTNKDNRKFIKDYEENYLTGVSHWSMTEAPEKINEKMEAYLKERNL